MRTRPTAGSALLACLAGALLALTSPASADPRAPLTTHGRWIVDADGRVVIVHGFNMVNKLPPYQPAAIGFGADDARLLRAHGFNAVRLGVILKGLEPRRGAIDEAYLEQTNRTYRTLARRHLFVQLDFHQDMFNERFSGEGWPDWAVIDDGLPAQPDAGFPGNYLLMPPVTRAFDHFWANDPAPGDTIGLQDRYAAAWTRVARRFRDASAVLGYDLLNEPWPGSEWPACFGSAGCPTFDAGALTAFHRKVIAAIRTVDTATTVFYEAPLPFDFGAASNHGDTNDRHAAFSWHPYCASIVLETNGVPTGMPGRDEACTQEEDFPFTNAEAVARRNGDAHLITEFGATDDVPSLERIMDRADAERVGWLQWTYFNEDPCCKRPAEGLVKDPRRPPSGDNLKQDKLAASARPYPQAVAGTPEPWQWDRATRTFTAAWSTTLPNGRRAPRKLRTEIAIPRLHFPRGYSVKVQDGRVISSRGARILRLVSTRGARRVSVTVSPALP